MEKKVWFDMDGTLVDFYSVDNWLQYLEAGDPTPYRVARGLGNLSLIARKLNTLQRAGYSIGIISWTSKSGSKLYNELVKLAKVSWLRQHMSSVSWDVIKIVPYGTDKRAACGSGILFDDELKNRASWGAGAYTPQDITPVLSALIRG